MLRRPPVRLNCGGTVLLVGRSTLAMSGSQLLARIANDENDDAFLDRSAQNVSAVLEWCRNRVVATHLVPSHVLLAEAEFFSMQELVSALRQPKQGFFVSPCFDSDSTANAWLSRHAGRITACHTVNCANTTRFLCYGQQKFIDDTPTPGECCTEATDSRRRRAQ